MRIANLVWLAGVSLVINGCGDHRRTQLEEPFRSSLEGSWKLARILCDGDQSTVLPDSVLSAEAGVKSWVKHTGRQGAIAWDLGTCSYRVAMENIDFQPDSKMKIQYQTPVCDGSTCGGFNACTSTAHQETLPYGLVDEKLTVTIPITEFNGQIPCGPGQTSEKVQFVYDRFSGTVPGL